MASQGQWQEMFSHYIYVALRTPQSASFLILHDWERITASGKVRSITWHLRHGAILKEYSKEVKCSRLKGSQLWMWLQPQDHCDSYPSSGKLCLHPPINDPHCHESSPCSARIMCLFIPLHGGEGSRDTQRTWCGAKGNTCIKRPRILQPFEYMRI